MSALPILHRDPDLVVVNKPAGLLVIPGRAVSSEPSARELLERELAQPVWVVHRLDRDTSGVLVFALTAAAHRSLSMAFEAGEVTKHYLALVTGRLETLRQVDSALVPARRGRMRTARAGEEGKASTTIVRPLEWFLDATLVQAKPLSGRTHQIRVHLQSIGHPLLVDPQYGPRRRTDPGDEGPTRERGLLQRTPLHASRLELPSAGNAPALSFEAPLAADFQRALTVLRSEPAAALSSKPLD